MLPIRKKERYKCILGVFSDASTKSPAFVGILTASLLDGVRSRGRDLEKLFQPALAQAQVDAPSACRAITRYETESRATCTLEDGMSAGWNKESPLFSQLHNWRDRCGECSNIPTVRAAAPEGTPYA